MSAKDDLVKRDQKHLWHPLTQHQIQPNPIPIIKAKGALLYDEHNKRYIDAISSWYTCMFGHCNDTILEKVSLQMQQLDQIVFAGFTHQPAIELSENLMKILPDNQQKLFFSDNGSTANEVAIKMTLQYHFNKNHKKSTLIAFENAFHGDTFGAMSTSGLSVYNGPFADYLIDIQRIPTPNKENIDSVLQLVKSLISSDKIAAFIYEP